jgi:hypothetical protein
MPALTCLWPRLEDHLVLRFEGIVWKRGFLSSSLASSESLMLSKARRIFPFVVHSEAPKYLGEDQHLGRQLSCPPWSLKENLERSSSDSLLTWPSSSEVE